MITLDRGAHGKYELTKLLVDKRLVVQVANSSNEKTYMNETQLNILLAIAQSGLKLLRSK